MTTLEARDGWLYVVHVELEYSQPVLVRVWWPLGIPVSRFAPEATGQTLTREGGGAYRSGRGVLYRLPDGGATRPAFTEREPVPAPRTRLQTRWHAGRWQKMTRHGWVTA